MEDADVPAAAEEAMRWSLAHGLVIAAAGSPAAETRRSAVPTAAWGLADGYTARAVHAPMTLLPSPVPRAAFESAVALAPDFNAVVDAVARDGPFLRDVHAGVVGTDAFTAALLDVYEDAPAQPLMLGLFRSDYMLQQATGALRQIELNTISSSFAALGTLTRAAHVATVRRFRTLPAGADVDAVLPPNTAWDGLCAAMAQALRAYTDAQGRPACILFVVQPHERNQYDQRHLQYRLEEAHGAVVLRRTLTDLAAGARRDGRGALVVDGLEVGLVYYRAGYTPADYPTAAEWVARRVVEQSLAVKCPSAGYHLAGTKKVQQALAQPGVLERYAPSAGAAARIRACFAGLHGLEPSAPGRDDAIARALRDPEAFVLKPQREGGGNNLYGDDMVAALRSLPPDELGAHILMERIHPPLVPTYILRDGTVTQEDAVWELGVFAALLSDGTMTHCNAASGHLLRTKAVRFADGGVAAGVAALDSPRLVS